MKRIFFLLLAPIAIGGMFTNVIAQPDVSEKWVITPVPNMKGVLGRLDINFPADVERNILIYQTADNKFLRSVSRNDKIYPIAPGEYRFTLTNVPVDNVPIQKGHETRLKAGFLDIVSEGDWHLYDETKEKAYTSGNKPKKLPLPVGSYQIKLGGQFYPVIIKDGETVEDYSPVKIKQEFGTEIKDEIKNQEKLETIETDKWVLTPTNVPSSIKGSNGAIDMRWPEAVDGLSYITTVMDSVPLGQAMVAQCKYGPCPEPFPLSPGKYTVYHQQGVSVMHVKGVPIRSGYETRLKMGIIEVLFSGSWRVLDSLKRTVCQYECTNFKKKLFPVGVYYVVNGGVEHRVEVIDMKTVVLKPGKSLSEVKWVITPLKVELKEGENGRLDMDFPGESNWTLRVYKTGFDQTFSPDNVKKMKFSSYSLPPGIYKISLNGFLVDSVPIESGMKTRILSSLLKINTAYADGVDTAYIAQAEEGFWYIFHIENTYQFYKKKGQGSFSIVLPVGNHGIKMFGAYPLSHIVIIDKEVTNLNLQLGILRIVNSSTRPWTLSQDKIGVGSEWYDPVIKQSDGIGKIEGYNFILGVPIGNYIITTGNSPPQKVTVTNNGSALINN